MRHFLILFLFTAFQGLSQTTEFKDTCILFLKYVDPEACDYPSNLAFFHSYEEYLSLKYSGTISKDSLVAERLYYELDYDEDTVCRHEKIVVHFGSPTNDFRHIKYSSYTLKALEGYNTEINEYENQWNIHEAKIDYVKETLNYSYQRNPVGNKLQLQIEKPNVENIEFLKYLCYFYLNENHKGTTFKKIGDD